jgi:prephenate dehydratase
MFRMDSTRPTIGYLGPEGTFTQQALLVQNDLSTKTHIPFRTVPDVLEAVEKGVIEFGFVPIENSIEGTVNYTQDALVFDHDLLIQREVVLDIELCLLAKAGVTLEQIQQVYSMPVATAQCHRYLRTILTNADIRVANSTAEAGKIVGESSVGEKIAAVAPRNAANLYGLNLLAENIADEVGNQTRFVLVAKEGIPAPTGNDRTAIVVFQRADEPGSLLSILQEFAARRINLSQLISRPTKKGGLGDYCFIMYVDGHIGDELVADAIRDLRAKQGDVKFMGSYPAAGVHAHTTREHADARWREADDWVSALRSQIAR